MLRCTEYGVAIAAQMAFYWLASILLSSPINKPIGALCLRNL